MRFHEAVHGVYFDDLDAMQILHNARFVLLIERTIGAFFAHLGWGSILEREKNPDQAHLIRKNLIEYQRPVTDVGELRVRVWVEKLGRTSLTFGFRVLPLDEDVDYASGERVLVRIDPATRRPTPWTDPFRARLAPYRRDLEAIAPGGKP
jgi:acyl-CoA thioester hydrolase